MLSMDLHDTGAVPVSLQCQDSARTDAALPGTGSVATRQTVTRIPLRMAVEIVRQRKRSVPVLCQLPMTVNSK